MPFLTYLINAFINKNNLGIFDFLKVILDIKFMIHFLIIIYNNKNQYYIMIR